MEEGVLLDNIWFVLNTDMALEIYLFQQFEEDHWFYHCSTARMGVIHFLQLLIWMQDEDDCRWLAQVKPLTHGL